jgi:2-dehydro-3-deoxygalactonokinase
MPKNFISLDWGTTSFRAYLVGADGAVKDQFAAPEGILAVKDGAFEATLESHIGGWDKALPVVASGMITSRQGWVEVPYAECPAGVADLAKAISLFTTKSGRRVHFIGGVHYNSLSIHHDVMRGEETQVIGALATGATHFITPGTHSKWISVSNARIVDFATYMTGESFALYRDHSILGRLMKEGPQDNAAFTRGAAHSFQSPSGLLHSLFSVRSLGLFSAMAPEKLASYLSGLLIGQEVVSAISSHQRNAQYLILGTPALAANYVIALKLMGLNVEIGNPLCSIDGQRLIAHAAGVI